MDIYKFLNLVPNSEGSLTRINTIPTLPAFEDENCISNDIPLNQTHNTWFRIYRPRATSPTTKLPVIIHVHGGGFVLFSAATAPFDAFCRATAVSLPAIVLSVEYRLAPEHRLPAAYEDTIEVLKWVRDNPGNEEWMRQLGDPSRCFLFGTSSGGNIAYFAALMAQAVDLGPVKIDGVIMNQPFFGGILRTESELKLINDRILPLAASDLMWELSLPTGADRNHRFCNATVVPEEDKAAVGLLPKCLVKGYGGDPLLDRQKEVVRMLKERGVHVVERFDEDGYHGVEFLDPTKSHSLLMDIKNFVLGSSSLLRS